MVNPTEALGAKLHRLREKFVDGLPQRLDALAGAIDRRDRDEMTRQFHSLAGTAGTHGLPAIAALAAEGEEACAAEALDDEGIAYLNSIVDSLRDGTPAGAAAPHVVAVEDEHFGRILCVEDDPDQLRYVCTILEDAGYEVRTIDDPTDFDFAVSMFHPDLILMDIILPGTTGVELTRTIRGDAAYATVPIVFLTTRRQVESRIEAAGAGGDDYLIKPVEPALLLSIVSARLRSSRAVKGLIDHDGLTGVLTHAAFVRRAQAELARAQRHGGEIALVMLDLDHFKSINDTHGHLAGDQVLAAFASFLTRSVRAGDEVGRYGGEEFALLLRNVTRDGVQTLVNRLLDEFKALSFRGARGKTFRVTFSAGVAMLGSGGDLGEWRQRADEALYSAKHRGRARVEAA